jgi:cobyric acid synthase
MVLKKKKIRYYKVYKMEGNPTLLEEAMDALTHLNGKRVIDYQQCLGLKNNS